MPSGRRHPHARHVAVHRLELPGGNLVCLVPDPDVSGVANQSVEISPGGEVTPIRGSGKPFEKLEGLPILHRHGADRSVVLDVEAADVGILGDLALHPPHGLGDRNHLQQSPDSVQPCPDQEDHEVLVVLGCPSAIMNHLTVPYLVTVKLHSTSYQTYLVAVKMSPPSTYHHGDLRTALLREAAAVLETSGAESISLRALARTLGVSHAAPGHHFASRHDLLVALATEGFSELADALESSMDRSPDADRLEESGEAYVRFALANPGRYRLMFTSSLSDLQDSYEELDTQSRRAYEGLLRSAHGEGYERDLDSYRVGPTELRVWALVHGAVMLKLDSRIGGDMTEDVFLALVGQMLRSDPPS